MKAPHGYTLAEVAVVLLLLSILYGTLMPPLARWRDRWAVRAARNEVAAALAVTRLAAAGSGGATLVLEPTTAVLSILPRDGSSRGTLDLRDRYGVTISPGGEGEDEAAIGIRYDALGIGRFANRTLVFRRGAAEEALVISAYGRARR